MLRFHSPLIEPDVRISRIRLSDGIRTAAHDPIELRSSPPVLVLATIAESFAEVVGNMATLPTLDGPANAPEVRPLPSIGITRLHQYYEPLRLPARPDLSLTRCRLVREPPSRVSRVASSTPLPCAIVITPAEYEDRDVQMSLIGGLPYLGGRSASATALSGPARRSRDCAKYQTAAGVMAHQLAEPPSAALCHRRLSPVCYLPSDSDCFRLER
jgi:hypothetical protein